MDKADIVCENTHTHTHNGQYLTVKKEERMPFAATWMDLRDYYIT